jgi:hypothetical protein
MRFCCPSCGFWLDRDGFPYGDGTLRCECQRMRVRHMVRGDTFVFDVQVLRVPPGSPPRTPPVPVNITGWFMWWTLKYHFADTDQQAVGQSTSTPTSTPAGGGIVFTLATAGKAEITMGPLATRVFPDGPVRLVYDVQVKDPSGNPFTVERGILIVSPDVTRAIA